MPDLRYYDTLNVFPRTPDGDSFIVLLDQSGANPAAVRALGSTLITGFASVTTGGTMINGAGNSGTPLTISGQLDANDIVNPSISSSTISNDIFVVTDLNTASNPTGTFLTLDTSDATLFTWEDPVTVSSTTANTDPVVGWDLATGDIEIKSLINCFAV